jgi:hypothetical protein
MLIYKKEYIPNVLKCNYLCHLIFYEPLLQISILDMPSTKWLCRYFCFYWILRFNVLSFCVNYRFSLIIWFLDHLTSNTTLDPSKKNTRVRFCKLNDLHVCSHSYTWNTTASLIFSWLLVGTFIKVRSINISLDEECRLDWSLW